MVGRFSERGMGRDTLTLQGQVYPTYQHADLKNELNHKAKWTKSQSKQEYCLKKQHNEMNQHLFPAHFLGLWNLTCQ